MGARGPAPGSITVLPTVKTRKKVPINSTKYFLIQAAHKNQIAVEANAKMRLFYRASLDLVGGILFLLT
jgi:hypothetical protein